MLNSGKKIRASPDKKINILTLVLSGKKIRNETKNHNPPPLQVKWSVPFGGLNLNLNFEKNILILVEEKNNLIQSFCHIA
jgi:hypothetical protein